MPVVHIETVSLFPLLDKKLIELLGSLSPEEWNLPTIARQWRVKDVAVHLLHGNVRMLSGVRDGYRGKPAAIRSWDDLVTYINTENNQWVDVWHVVSPSLLIDLLAYTGEQYSRFVTTVDLLGPAPYGVAWAGESSSLNWFNIAREYTEKWHHQQQIRDAVGKPGLMTDELYKPCLDTFMRALPYTYRGVAAEKGTVLRFTISGKGGGDWWLIMEDQWTLSAFEQSAPVAHTTIDGLAAWKLFTKSWRKQDVAEHVTIQGDERLGGVVLEMVSVMA